MPTPLRPLLFVLTLLPPLLAGVPLRAQNEPRVSELLASADESWKTGQYNVAFDRYQAVLRRDSTSARALFRVATLLAWRNDLNRSESLFRVYLRIAPGDDDGRVALARTLAWN